MRCSVLSAGCGVRGAWCVVRGAECAVRYLYVQSVSIVPELVQQRHGQRAQLGGEQRVGAVARRVAVVPRRRRLRHTPRRSARATGRPSLPPLPCLSLPSLAPTLALPDIYCLQHASRNPIPTRSRLAQPRPNLDSHCLQSRKPCFLLPSISSSSYRNRINQPITAYAQSYPHYSSCNVNIFKNHTIYLQGSRYPFEC